MAKERKYRTTVNSTEWMLESDKWGCALYLRGNANEEYHFSGEWFKTADEAEAFLDGIDRRLRTPLPNYADVVIPADYYGRTGRYYAD